MTGNQRRWSSKKMESGLQPCNLDLAPTCTSEQRLEFENLRSRELLNSGMLLMGSGW